MIPTLARNTFLQCHVKPEHSTDSAMEKPTPKCDPHDPWEHLFCNKTKNTSFLHTSENQSYIENVIPTLARNTFLQCHVKPEHRTDSAKEKPTQECHPHAWWERLFCNLTKHTSFVGTTENQTSSYKWQIHWKQISKVVFRTFPPQRC